MNQPDTLTPPPAAAKTEHGVYVCTFHTQHEYQRSSTGLWKRYPNELSDLIGFDAQGRECSAGRDFDRAEREDAWPVRIYRRREG